MSKSRALINELLVNVFNNILGIEEDVLKARGVKLSVKEVHILEAARNSPEPTMSAIAKKLRITTGTLTASINRLVAKKLVIRANDETDRRKVLIKLAPPALETLTVHDEFHGEMIDAIFDDMKIDEDATLAKSLENISGFFKKRYS